jgi:4-hydroxy-3-methylbut-2-en-1-yl diphosphate reductase
MKIYLAREQGFCSGVASAVQVVEKALANFGPPLYVYHEIVHNTYVVNDFKGRGVVFVDKLTDVPIGNKVIFSAHGVPPKIIQEAKDRQLECIDATCPLVKRIHREAQHFSDDKCHIILIGHKGHQEMIGTSGYVAPELLHIIQNEMDIEKLSIPAHSQVAYLTQTTLSVDETQGLIQKLMTKFPHIQEPTRSDICYATQQRQDAVKELAKLVDLIIVCGSPTSSNSNRLRETGEHAGVESLIIDRAEELKETALFDKHKIGISSGASVPWCVVESVIQRIQKWYPQTRIYRFDKEQKNHILVE